MPETLTDWCEAMLPRIREISTHAALLYSEAGRLSHYQEVARRLEEQFGVAALAQAGFLHGIGAAVLEHELGDVSADVLSILRARDRLAAMEVQSSEDLRKLESNVLPSLGDARGALLLVTEQLHHVDPDAVLEPWVREFHLRPTVPPRGLNAAPRFTTPSRHEPEARYPAFLRSVVAPVARRFGLWHEKDVIEDAALLLESADRHAAVVAFAVAMSASEARYASRVKAVRELLGGGGIRAVRWEWRHVASMSRALPRGEWTPARPAEWLGNLHHCGYVTVVCADTPSCYAALGRLHTREHRDAAFRDTLASGLESDYRALHTEVHLPVTPGGPPSPVSVRLLPTEADRVRFHLARGPQRCADAYAAGPEAVGDGMEVFAPDGRAVVLPPGATVLNFAYKIHNSLPAFVREAQVNRHRTDLLHPLRSGDVVWLNLGEEPRPLPEGWQERVPRETVSHIRESWRYVFRRALIQSGRRWLGQYLAMQGVGDPPDDAQLNELVDAVEDRLHRHGHIADRKGREWWYVRLGEHAAELRGELPSGRSARHVVLRREFLDGAAKELIFARKVAELRSGEAEYSTRLCAMCKPQLDRGPLVFALKGAVLFLHVADARCAPPESEPVDRHFPRPKYVTVVGGDRAGLASDVFRVFEQTGVGIAHIDGMRVGRGVAMLRVQLDPISPELLATVQTALRATPTLQVYGPGDSPPLQEILHLAPRRAAPLPTVAQEPHVAGPAVTEDARFYGMEMVLKGLQDELNRVSSPSAPQGGNVFVQGPKRVGKTSAVLHFLRRLGRERAVVPVYCSAQEGEGWSALQARMAHDLLTVAREQSGATGVAGLGDELAGLPLDLLVGELRRRLLIPIILAFDEATYLMDASRSQSERRGIRDFAARVRSHPGVLALWIGPTAARRAVATLMALVQSARDQRISPLTPGEVGSLLAAEKFGRGCSIRVDDRVAERVYALTLGNPFWVTVLAAEMRNLEPSGPDGVTYFGEALLDRALPQVLRMIKPFMDRYWPEKGDSRARRLLTGTVLLRLARAHGGASPVAARTLWSAVSRVAAPPDATLFNEVLDDLHHRGSIEPVGTDAWKVSAPLLAQHILVTSGGEPRWITRV